MNFLACIIILVSLLFCTCIRASEDDPDTAPVDYCIIGGGSSGTYAAIRLQQPGKTVSSLREPHISAVMSTHILIL